MSWRLLLSLALAISAACSTPDRSDSTTDREGSPLLDRSRAQLVRALTAQPNPEPYPATQVTGRTYSVVRLDEEERMSKVESRWRPISQSDLHLMQLGPASVEKLADGTDVEEETRRKGERYRWLYFRDLAVAREEIGRILVEASFPGSSYFMLGWPGVAGFRIELDRPDRPTRYSLSTDGLVRWKGKLKWFRVGVPITDDNSDPQIVVESLAFEDRRSRFPDPVGTARVRLGRVVKSAVYLHGDSTLAYAEVPAAASKRLAFSVATVGEPLELTVTTSRTDGRSPSVLFRRRVANQERWESVSLDLPPGNSPAHLTFTVKGAPESVLLLGAPVTYAPESAPPRVLLYLVDALGAVHSSLYGYPRRTTPHLEELASEGAWFANAWANAPLTPTSVPNLLTSLQSRSHGVIEQFARLGPEFLTVQEAFAQAGFATVAFSTNANAGPLRGTDQGFDAFYDHIAFRGTAGKDLTVPVEAVLGWLEAHRDRPVFVYIHTAEPHDPYDPPEPFATKFDPEYDGLVGSQWKATPKVRFDHGFTARDLEHLEARYDGAVAYADDRLRVFWEALRQEEFMDGLLAIVTSDHGEEFAEHGVFGHGQSVSGSLLRVPLVLWGPDYLNSVGRIEAPAGLIDVMPTLLDLLGLHTTAPMQGRSLAGFLRGGVVTESEIRPILAEGYLLGTENKFAWLEGRWKLEARVDKAGDDLTALSLYDLNVDPEEQKDLAAAREDVVYRLAQSLASHYGGLPRYEAGSDQEIRVEKEQLDRLRALGYLD